MPELILDLKTITPLIMYGANNDTRSGDRPELRASSFRGIFRYWLRSILNVDTNVPSQLVDAEAEYFGSTSVGSYVTVRVQQGQTLNADTRQKVLPDRFPFKAFEPEGDFRVRLITHPLVKPDKLVQKLSDTCFLAFHLGGLGRRARRGGGSVRIVNATYKNADADENTLAYLPDNGDELATFLKARVSDIAISSNSNQKPDYPRLTASSAKVLVDTEPYRSYMDALNVMWRITVPHHHDGGAYGQVKGGRRASAIHMRVSESRVGLHPVMTIFYSGKQDNNWRGINDIVSRSQSDGFELVFGNQGAWS